MPSLEESSSPRIRVPALFAVAAALVAVLAVSGYFLGRTAAPGPDEASSVRTGAARAASREAELVAYRRGQLQGRARGLVAGRQAGRKRGSTKGREAGEQRLAAIQQQRAAAAAAAEAAERRRNCGAPLFAEDYCPTDEEIAQENDIEGLCGPGTEAGKQEALKKYGVRC